MTSAHTLLGVLVATAYAHSYTRSKATVSATCCSITQRALALKTHKALAVGTTRTMQNERQSNMRYFTPNELKCQHCGAHGIDTAFVDLLDSLRAEAGFAFPITSGYRCADHPIEARKAVPGSGAHCSGKAVDIGVRGDRALRLIELALGAGIQRIGVNQKGSSRFIHLDVCNDKTTPTIWSY